MAEHYYYSRPTSSHEERSFDAVLGERHFHFLTDAGVFSKGRIDFGSRLLLDSFLTQHPEDLSSQFLELGSGYGPLTLALASHYPHAHILGLEINQRAFQLAKQNAEINQITNCQFELADVSQWEVQSDFNYVVTNPPIRAGKKIIQSFVSKAYQALEEKGEFWLVIQKKQGAPSMQNFIESTFGNVQLVDRSKGYWILQALK